jgi:hypothetical protein
MTLMHCLTYGPSNGRSQRRKYGAAHVGDETIGVNVIQHARRLVRKTSSASFQNLAQRVIGDDDL